MEHRSKISPRAKVEAATWLARLHADRRSDADEQGFREWLAADPENTIAFQMITDVWEGAGAIKSVRSAIPRRAALVGIGAMLSIGATSAIGLNAYAHTYKTDVGEQKRVVMRDGTYALLDTDTRVRAHFGFGRRTVDLQRGRANFRVTDERVPFVVQAASMRIVAQRAEFDVRRQADDISVVLIKGDVRVEAEGAGAEKRRVLSSGQRLIAASPFQTRIDEPNLAPLVSWQTGQAIFDDATLADAVAEMNRYATLKLVIEEESVRQLRISGVYRVGDNALFAQSISALLPLQAVPVDGHLKLAPNFH